LAPLALASLINDERSARGAAADNPMAMRRPHLQPRAQRVIFLDMLGGPSQLDLFDPKPELTKRDGEFIPESFLKKIKFAQIQDKRPKLMASPWRFARHGDSGTTVSELLPYTAQVVDQLSVIRTLRTDDTNHLFAELQLNTGWRAPGLPTGWEANRATCPGSSCCFPDWRRVRRARTMETVFCPRPIRASP
jgi:hypothetical protein